MKEVKTNHLVSLISNIRDKANRVIISELEKNSIYNLAPSHGNILQLLFYSNEPLTMQDIAIKINRDKSTVTSLVNKLVQLGYVEKQKDQEDSRKTIIVLTQKGWELEHIFKDISKKLIDRVYTNISIQEQKEVINVLEKIEKNL